MHTVASSVPTPCPFNKGRGYYKYLRMPFGLTGAPLTFGEMTATNLDNLIGVLFDLFVDDGGMGGSDFEKLLEDLRTLLMRVQEKGLSLSASKSKFFVTEAVFAGARVGPQGIFLISQSSRPSWTGRCPRICRTWALSWVSRAIFVLWSRATRRLHNHSRIWQKAWRSHEGRGRRLIEGR